MMQLGKPLREPEPPHLPRVVQVEGNILMAFVSDGFLLINAHRASKRVLHDALLSRQRRVETPIFPLKIPCEPALADRTGLLRRLGFEVEIKGGFAVIKTLPHLPWPTDAEALEDAFRKIVDLPPLAVDDAVRIMVESLCLPRNKPMSPRSAAQLTDALFSSDEPFVGPYGGVIAARFTWKELTRGIS